MRCKADTSANPHKNILFPRIEIKDQQEPQLSILILVRTMIKGSEGPLKFGNAMVSRFLGVCW
jgi:hypothetical protein